MVAPAFDDFTRFGVFHIHGAVGAAGEQKEQGNELVHIITAWLGGQAYAFSGGLGRP